MNMTERDERLAAIRRRITVAEAGDISLMEWVNHAREDIPFLLDELEADKKHLADLRAELDLRMSALEAMRTLAGKLVAAVWAWDLTLSDYCDGDERDAVRKALAAAEKAGIK